MSLLKEKLLPLLRLLFNKWIIAFAIFFVYIVFNNDMSIVSYWKQKAKLADLQEQKKYLINKIETNKERIDKLKSNQKNLERFAREQFYMHKDDEDVFIVVEED